MIDYQLERVILSVTNDCNLRCLHCYTNGGDKSPVELGEAELRRLMDDIISMCPSNLTISGGEPLLNPDKVKMVAEMAHQAGIKITLTTNGTLLTKEVCAWLKQINIDIVQISIDSDRADEHDAIRGQGNYKRAVKGLITAVEAGLTCSVMMVAFRHNWNRLSALYEAAALWGAKLLGVDRFVPIGRGKALESLKLGSADLLGLHRELERCKDKSRIPIVTNDPIWNAFQLTQLGLADYEWARDNPLGCSAGIRSCVINADGMVYPCTFLDTILGDVRINTIKQIVAIDNPVIKLLSNRDQLKGQCGCCDLRYICGGCRAEAAISIGDFLQEDPLCPRLSKSAG